MTPTTVATASVAAVPNRSTASVQKMLWVTVGLVFLVVVWGAVVRLTGSGLSIPDWPMINGSFLPPFSEAGWHAVQEDYHAEALRLEKPGFPANLSVGAFRRAFWIEYSHRTLAALVGIALLAAIIMGMRNPLVRQKIELNLYMLATLLLTQAGLGGVVVKGALHGVLVAIHLVVAYTFFAFLLWTILSLTHRESVPSGGSKSAGYTPLRLAWLTVGLIGLQVAFGGLTAGSGAASIMNTYPLMAGSLIPPSELLWNPAYSSAGSNFLLNQVLVQFVHRWLPIFILGAYVALRLKTLHTPMEPRAQILFRAVAALIGLQIVIGVFNLLYRAPVLLSALHSGVALIFFGGMVILLHDLRYQSGEGAIVK